MPEIRIYRSARKTVAMRVIDGNTVEVRAPFGVSDSYINSFVMSYSDKIEKIAAEQLLSKAAKQNFRLTYGSTVRYLGENYYIMARNCKKPGFDGEVFFFPPDLDDEEIKKSLLKMLKGLAGEYIRERTAELAAEMGCKYSTLRIMSAATRWGSCGGSNTLNFSWNLIFAGSHDVDSVIIHELAHTVHHNHGKAFWNKVYRHCPDYGECKKRLNALARELSLENWK